MNTRTTPAKPKITIRVVWHLSVAAAGLSAAGSIAGHESWHAILWPIIAAAWMIIARYLDRGARRSHAAAADAGSRADAQAARAEFWRQQTARAEGRAPTTTHYPDSEDDPHIGAAGACQCDCGQCVDRFNNCTCNGCSGKCDAQHPHAEAKPR